MEANRITAGTSGGGAHQSSAATINVTDPASRKISE
jgi:hypothetical protein